MRPPPEAGRDFQNRTRWQTLADPRKNCVGPLRGRAAPRLRPFLARFFPIVLHRMNATIADMPLTKMAGGGIEPPTRGFLVHVSRDRKLFASAASIRPSAVALV